MSRDAFKFSTADDRDLWVTSGGMCAKCKKVLILNDIEKKVSIGEKAHIIGKGTGKNAPRREFAKQYGFNSKNIDSIENIMLMCSGCHHVIDTNVENYPPDMLFEMKNKHEEWVMNRLSQNNKAIAVLYKRINSIPFDSVLLADEIGTLLLDAVSLQEEFTDFSPTGWEQAKKKNQEFFQLIVQTMREYTGAKLCIFPLSPIPLLIHLGKLISDTGPAIIYQYDRETQKWCLEDLSDKAEQQTIHVSQSDVVYDSLVVTIQVSGMIAEEEVKEAVDSPYQHLDLRIEKPRLNAVLYNHDLNAITKEFRKHVYALQDLNHYKDIHLFYYGPSGLAVELGRTINDSMLPEVHIYEHNRRGEKKYTRAITI
ncbi:SAVED domain-containing protein [Peribacillus frigoritolerans]|uniref:SAVED domain-containing protein n=1 Tax=Peribacillus frigoritolerans TaxID=450367 RepID=UPI002E1AB438|nr:SAVED domain-containing protein [Peribacillus frigoritolerans]